MRVEGGYKGEGGYKEVIGVRVVFLTSLCSCSYF